MDELREIRENADRIKGLANEIGNYERYKQIVEDYSRKLKNKKIDTKTYKKLLKGRKREDLETFYELEVKKFRDELLALNNEIVNKVNSVIVEEEKAKAEKHIEKDYIKELGLEKSYVRNLIKRKEKKEEIISDYSLYNTNAYGEMSNLIIGKATDYVIKKIPKVFEDLKHNLQAGDVKIISRTYLSITIFSSLLTFLMSAIIFQILGFGILMGILIGILAATTAFVIVYYYPLSEAAERRRKIKNDLPFVIIHMAAVAGSGAQPIAMFNLLLRTGEFKGIKGEIRKIVNYVNLFGYDLSSAMKRVARITPSADFRELLHGLTTTTESGGSIREYLNAKAEDTMGTYRMERKKYVQTLSTYSDLYTGIFIAAPLLFFITLAIIQGLGGKVLGVSANALAVIGTYGIIPALNVFFIIFLNIIQPKT